MWNIVGANSYQLETKQNLNTKYKTPFFVNWKVHFKH